MTRGRGSQVPKTFNKKNDFRLKSFSDAVLSKQPSPKNFLQIFLSLILTNFDQIHRVLFKNTRKKFAKNS